MGFKTIFVHLSANKAVFLKKLKYPLLKRKCNFLILKKKNKKKREEYLFHTTPKRNQTWGANNSTARAVSAAAPAPHPGPAPAVLGLLSPHAAHFLHIMSFQVPKEGLLVRLKANL